MLRDTSPEPQPWTSNRMLAWLVPADYRQLAMLAVIILVSVALRLLTWDVVADGGFTRYAKTAIFGGFAAAVVWLLIRIQATPASRLPFLAALVVLLSGDAIHYVRLANPITRGGAVVAVNSDFSGEAPARRDFDFETSGNGRVAFEAGAVRLESPPRATAYLLARLGSAPNVAANWWLPVGLAERERTERLSWQATIRRTGPFYVVSEIRNLLVQAVGYGVHITYPDERKQMRGWEIQHPAGTDGQAHDWVIERDTQRISLSIDGKQVWSTMQHEALNQVKLGETKVDAEHGGSMSVQSVRYSSALDRR